MPLLKTSLNKNDLQEGKLEKVEIDDDKSIVLTKINGKYYAMDSVCSHEGGPLEDGELEGYSLICPWHQGKFDIRSAKASPETDWVTDLRSYPVVIDDSTGDISIDTG
jgi:nitrite reductase/ring-hydroxylating ferredoxin subunit